MAAGDYPWRLGAEAIPNVDRLPILHRPKPEPEPAPPIQKSCRTLWLSGRPIRLTLNDRQHDATGTRPSVGGDSRIMHTLTRPLIPSPALFIFPL